ncbi:hypothetical protein SAMN04488057_11211 [Cyclobacterium lianum]|uniref:Uncharacterized protein n=1 Tax=Cyclobacterium lianum TaxID=388280 RepID=A0A1M7PYM3_9BACT|nr:hypothetical protein [Cyclobacterium lianum]SHN22772.1 hypothetical protein SAMN04488057_11211 [Cyclobacterium lianum]
MKRFLSSLTGLLCLCLGNLYAQEKINQSLIVDGYIRSTSNLQAMNPGNPSATASLNWFENTARIRVGGNGIGAAGGLDIQTTGNRSLMRLLHNGKIGIGTSTPDARLTVNGNIRARELKLEVANWPDYVFSADYYLPPLAKVKQHIISHGRLPGFQPASHYQQEGLPLAETSRLLLEKIEELTLYLIQCEEKISALEAKVNQLQLRKKDE